MIFEYEGSLFNGEPSAPEWPLERSPAQLVTIEAAGDRVICVQGDDAQMVWTSLFREGTLWNQITVNHDGESFGFDGFPLFPARGLSFREACAETGVPWFDRPALTPVDRALLSLRAVADDDLAISGQSCPGLSSDDQPLVARVSRDLGVVCSPVDFDAIPTVVGYSINQSDVMLDLVPFTPQVGDDISINFGASEGLLRILCDEDSTCAATWEQGLLTLSVFGSDPTGETQGEFLETHFDEMLAFAQDLAE